MQVASSVSFFPGFTLHYMHRNFLVNNESLQTYVAA